ncbi:Spo0B C-terminal domain-containing protein [Fredinandcohnia humi]
MKKKWSTIEVLKHTRHDWLNKIQLIKGNIALQKLDRVNAIIEEIVIDAQNESNLTNLHIPSFACLVMTYNWEPHKCQLEYEVIGDTRDLSNYDHLITEWSIQFLSKLEESVDEMSDNHLSISIDTSAQETRFFFDFNGILKESETLTEWFQAINNQFQSIQISEYEVHKEEVSVKLHIA